ncbi:MAG: 23S rRNA (guanosine(2251)-2'-O)-methyltransferase RlmB [Inhella sp.]|jgi:23S rRNA (guanosine2251-2'-O)-methyltransferase|uniref:23S rRNA (guanosine(2251)-2'-O)-methyltransferase RlmB n=1 Tax=Inhella sp. TaxID=1921806 RepID=UPI0022C0FC27|nr:23S rRNA (guanosine(2251)-2'-O)-methyltransferase RlmB [Inhella sp.]MCZ8235895.1 23S rRNA (guanosine(2251)-2'-O)-methyltransferase RlmB [Inhella sp.]
MTDQPRTVLFGFHAISTRLKIAPASIDLVLFDASRRDARMKGLLARAAEAGVKVVETEALQLDRLARTDRHQGVVARVQALKAQHSLDDLLDGVQARGDKPLVLVLDGVTDPHNLGACLRVADGAGAHAVLAPRDHAVGLNATVAKVASGAAESVPYLMVTNLARTLGELKERDIVCVGTSDQAEGSLYQLPAGELAGPVAWVLGAEGHGLRQLTAKTCDRLVSIPMRGAVESLNVSVAAGVCLYESLRQRGG